MSHEWVWWCEEIVPADQSQGNRPKCLGSRALRLGRSVLVATWSFLNVRVAKRATRICLSVLGRLPNGVEIVVSV